MAEASIGDVVSHWSQLIENLQVSPQAFYASVAEAIATREIPGAKILNKPWPEGGLFSPRRLYLRVRRREYAIDVCGAPFGTGFFVSEWASVPPPRILVAVILVIIGVVVGYFLAADLLGVLRVMQMPAFATTEFWQERLIERCVWLGFDVLATMLVFTFGITRPFLFPPLPTYYRIDTAQMFFRAVHQSVREVVDGLCTAQGLRLLSDAEWKPVMRGFDR